MEVMFNAGGRPSALASVAARAVGSASPTVSFEIVHAGSDQETFERGRPVDVTNLPGSTAASDTPRESLCFEVPGARFTIRTWPSHEPRAISGITSVQQTGGDGENMQEYSCRGSIAVNPNFLYDSVRSAEMLLTLKQGPWVPDYADMLMVLLWSIRLLHLSTKPRCP